MGRPYVLLSCAVSVDGYLDGSGAERLLLSNAADFDRVDEVRAASDAILVGAGTIRRDDPRLLVRSAARRERRTARGLPPSPVKVALTRGGDLDPRAAFFTAGPADRLVYCDSEAAGRARERLGAAATVVGAGDPADLDRVLADLAGRGVGRLMVEGGSSVLTQFLAAGLADELQVAVAPLFVGDPAAPRFVGPGAFPHDQGNRMRLAEVRQVGDVALLRYLLGGAARRAGEVAGTDRTGGAASRRRDPGGGRHGYGGDDRRGHGGDHGQGGDRGHGREEREHGESDGEVGDGGTDHA